MDGDMARVAIADRADLVVRTERHEGGRVTVQLEVMGEGVDLVVFDLGGVPAFVIKQRGGVASESKVEEGGSSNDMAPAHWPVTANLQGTGRPGCVACTHLDGKLWCEPRGYCARQQGH